MTRQQYTDGDRVRHDAMDPADPTAYGTVGGVHTDGDLYIQWDDGLDTKSAPWELNPA